MRLTIKPNNKIIKLKKSENGKGSDGGRLHGIWGEITWFIVGVIKLMARFMIINQGHYFYTLRLN